MFKEPFAMTILALNLNRVRVSATASVFLNIIYIPTAIGFSQCSSSFTNTAHNSTLQKCGALWFIDILFFYHNFVVIESLSF
jgi:hypothetical protein